MSGLRLMCNDLRNIVYRYIHRYKLKQVNAEYKNQIIECVTVNNDYWWLTSSKYWKRYNSRVLEHTNYANYEKIFNYKGYSICKLPLCYRYSSGKPSRNGYK
jgi:hypothetical protein